MMTISRIRYFLRTCSDFQPIFLPYAEPKECPKVSKVIFRKQSQRQLCVKNSSRQFDIAKNFQSVCDGGHNQVQDFIIRRSFCRDHTLPKLKTVCAVLKDVRERFTRASIPESDVAAEYIVAHALGVCQLSEFSRVDQSHLLSDEVIHNIYHLAQQKLERVPLQYILGDWDFRDLTLKMRPPVFIPRPETEMLVDLVVSHYSEEDSWQFLEVGCGTGAISLSLLSEFQKARLTAIDGNEDAVTLTCENAERLGLVHRLAVHHALLTECSIPGVICESANSYDAIISNPPYIFSRDMDELDPEIALYEDHAALEAGPDGLSVIRAIVQQAGHLLKPGGLIWLETDVRHHGMISDWLQRHPETGVIFRESFVDFTNSPRFCQLEYSPPDSC